MPIKKLKDLDRLRTSPSLSNDESVILFKELLDYIDQADWFTLGIMAPSTDKALEVVQIIEKKLKWQKLNIASIPKEDGPVYLKGNQKTGDIHIRIEYGLGEGILISCQYLDVSINAKTIGPLPLNFFSAINI